LLDVGPRTPGCIRYEVKKCLGPCVAGCSAREYDERVALARAFLEGAGEGPGRHPGLRPDEPDYAPDPIARFRREMEEHSASLAYERAALARDRLRRLERLRE